MTLEEIKRQAIVDALERHGGVQIAAAVELGISARTINYQMKILGIPRATQRTTRVTPPSDAHLDRIQRDAEELRKAGA